MGQMDMTMVLIMLLLSVAALAFIGVGLHAVWRGSPAAQKRRVAGIVKSYARIRSGEVVRDISVTDGDGEAAVDLALIGYFGVLLITVLPEEANFYGDEESEKWLMTQKGEKTRFPNPLKMGERVAERVRGELVKSGIMEVRVEHLVVFTANFGDKLELAVNESLPICNKRRLRALLQGEHFEKDAGVDIPKTAAVVSSFQAK